LSTTQIPAPRETGKAYSDSLIADLGDRDALTVLSQLVPSLRAALDDIRGTDLEAPERPGGWSIRDVVEHLTDGDCILAFRTRMILAEDNPPIPAYDQDLWARNLARTRGTIEETMDELELVRRRNVRFFRSLSETDWQRVGIHSERGPESLDRIARLYAGHDIRHLRQIRRIAKALEGSK